MNDGAYMGAGWIMVVMVDGDGYKFPYRTAPHFIRDAAKRNRIPVEHYNSNATTVFEVLASSYLGW